jgi:hypothetical protein
VGVASFGEFLFVRWFSEGVVFDHEGVAKGRESIPIEITVKREIPFFVCISTSG